MNPSAGKNIANSTTLLTGNAILLTNEYFRKLKMKIIKLRDWINVITLLYEKTLETYMIDKRINEKEALDRKKFFIHYLDKRKEFMKNTNFRVEDKFGDIKSKDSISPEQLNKLNNLYTKIM